MYLVSDVLVRSLVTSILQCLLTTTYVYSWWRGSCGSPTDLFCRFLWEETQTDTGRSRKLHRPMTWLYHSTITCTCAYKTKSLKLKAVSLRCWTISLLLWSICSALSDPHTLHMLTHPRLHCSQVCPCVSALQSSTDTRRPAAPSASHSAVHLWFPACIAGWFAAPCAVGNLLFHLGWRNDEGINVLFGRFLFFPNYTFSSICLGLQSLKWSAMVDS